MRVLMFGWEFPPHITGGLGTACYGLTKGLKSIPGTEIIFVVPKLWGDEDKRSVELVGAGDIPVLQRIETTQQYFREDSFSNNVAQQTFDEQLYSIDQLYDHVTFVEIASLLSPYLSPEYFEQIIKEKKLERSKVAITKEGKLVYRENGVVKYVTVDYNESFGVDDFGRYTFSGTYGPNLMTEVANYAKVAPRIASNYTFDIIHAHDWLCYPAGVAAKKISGKPLVIHVHATEFDRSGESVNQPVYDIERYGMENADRIITVSNLTRNIVIEKYGIDPDKVFTVYNAVEPDMSERKKETKKIDDKIVTFLGRVTFQKGPDYFIEAAFRVLKRMDGVRFVMAGSGDMLKRMIDRAAELNISDRFHFTNFLKSDDVKRMFDISDVYVMPSVSEPFGISPLEAMRANVPVIISKQSGVAELLEHAVKVDYWDIDAMADAIYGILNYKALSEVFKKYGRKEVDDLQWENAAHHVHKVYLSAL